MSHTAQPTRNAQAVLNAISSRRSVRAFLPTEVSRETIEHILQTAAWSPSGSNIQPWKVQVLHGSKRNELARVLLAAHDAGGEKPEYLYYPKVWREPYLGRRRTTGWQLYEAQGIQKGDREAAHRYRATNYDFFGAPVGLIVTMDRDMEAGSWLDVGAFVQSVLVAARAFELDSCPQAAFANYGDLVRATLGLPDDQIIICGIAIGHADHSHGANRVRAGRQPLSGFATFRWDDEPAPPGAQQAAARVEDA
jgi:nitroreductase